MRRIVSLVFVLVLAAGAYFYQSAGPETPPAAPSYESVVPSGMLSPGQAAGLVKHYPEDRLAILDVRTPEEFAAGHAGKAVNIPVQELQERIAEVPQSPLLILCRSGKRAENAFNLLRDSGRNMAETWFLKGFTDYRDGIPSFHE
ncbi:MAG: rhodanese-like domain-containing protein [Mailhella sp.]|nr:rhodanese-like domain-containing protein [Mailhella sp.]